MTLSDLWRSFGDYLTVVYVVLYVQPTRDLLATAKFLVLQENKRYVFSWARCIWHKCPQVKVGLCDWTKIRQVSQQQAYRRQTMRNTQPFFSKATFPSLTACLYLLNSSDPEWCLRQASNITSAFCDIELWPHNHQGRPFIPLPPGEIFANLHWNRFIRFEV